MRLPAAILFLALGCGGESGGYQPMQCKDILQEDTVHLESSLDLLLVVGNGGSMAEEQAALADEIEWLVDRLGALPRGLPDLHVAVMSDDGTGLAVPDQCPDLSDGSAFISDLLFDPQEGAREINYSGGLAEQLACMAAVGTSGDGVQHPLASVAGVVEDHASGFRRPGAALAIAIVTDGEDASPEDVPSYASRVRARAPQPAPVVVSVVSGGLDGCALDGFTDAAPAPRLAAFADAFGSGDADVSLCGEGPLLAGVAAAASGLEVGACIGDELAMPPDCRVHDVLHPGQAEHPIPSCDEAGPPCFAIAADPLRCPDTGSHLRLTLDRGGAPPPAGSSTAAVCRIGPDCPQ